MVGPKAETGRGGSPARVGDLEPGVSPAAQSDAKDVPGHQRAIGRHESRWDQIKIHKVPVTQESYPAPRDILHFGLGQSVDQRGGESMDVAVLPERFGQARIP